MPPMIEPVRKELVQVAASPIKISSSRRVRGQ
jgi:hypothetical protein